jgi:hypothetical protein
MEAKVLEELKQIKLILSKITGTEGLPEKERFSDEALEKAAKEFQNLVIKRGEWISNNDIDEVFKKTLWRAGEFIIEKFKFRNYFKRSKILYFNKKDLIALRNDLKDRRVDLRRYMELEEDKEKFEKYIAEINLPKGKGKTKSYQIPEELQDIETKPYIIPEGNIKTDIEKLKEEFRNKKLAEYIDIYEKGTYAMFKDLYYFDKYLEAGLKRDCKNWCNRFNYANNALKKLDELIQEGN